MPKITLASCPETNRTGYPPPYDAAVAGRWVRRLGPASGLTEFGVSHVRLAAGAWSSQRHWHEDEDEFLVMLAGQAVLIDDAGRTPMGPGDCAAFPKNDRNGHHLVNESDADCLFIVIGRPAAGTCHYPDIDLLIPAGGNFAHKDGTPY